MLSVAGKEVVFSSVVIFEDARSVDIELFYRGKHRNFMTVWELKQTEGRRGIVYTRSPHGMSLSFIGWGGSEGGGEVALEAPLRIEDEDGQRFELQIVHKRVAQFNHAAIQITAVERNYAGPYTAPIGSKGPVLCDPVGLT